MVLSRTVPCCAVPSRASPAEPRGAVRSRAVPGGAGPCRAEPAPSPGNGELLNRGRGRIGEPGVRRGGPRDRLEGVFPAPGAEGMLRRSGRGQRSGRGVNRVGAGAGVSRSWGSPAGLGDTGAPRGWWHQAESHFARAGSSLDGWMERRGLYGGV